MKVIGFIDDDKASHNKTVDGIPVIGTHQALPELKTKYGLEGVIIAVGDNKTRALLFNKVKGLGLKLENAIHHNALIARDVEIGEGVVIASGAMINTGTKIGNNVILNTGVVINHDNIIEDHVHISPGVKLDGKVTVKEGTHVGIGVTVGPYVVIGKNVTVGGGAVVLENIPDNVTAVGIPARVVKHKEIKHTG
jgi:UDP-perosamine 4-acetyltransferase